MMTQLCQELNNWFDRGQEKFFGTITIHEDGTMTCNNSSFSDSPITPLEGQFFRIVGSALNDGAHQYPDTSMLQETFEDGAVWLMAVPPTVRKLAEKIQAWRDKYESVDSAAMSPFNSESYSVYSYSKGSGSSGKSGYNPSSWQSVFSNQLNAWRKV
jgi:hypothetical protein